MSFRIINTCEAIKGPRGIPYVHDAARPFAVLRSTGAQEICVGRHSTESGAQASVRLRLSAGKTKNIICHASGDRCLGCKHYHGKADCCEFARAI